MYLQTKIAIADATRFIFWVAGMKKCFCGRGFAPDPAEGAYSAPQTP